MAGPISSPNAGTLDKNDPRSIIDQAPMTIGQVIVVAITVMLNAMDGFDILSIAFASNGIAAEWQITTQALGFVLSMELVGMALGSVLLGGVADRIGRRPTLLACLVTMAFGMFMATTSASPTQLSIWRVVTGLGMSYVHIPVDFNAPTSQDFRAFCRVMEAFDDRPVFVLHRIEVINRFEVTGRNFLANLFHFLFLSLHDLLHLHRFLDGAIKPVHAGGVRTKIQVQRRIIP